MQTLLLALTLTLSPAPDVLDVGGAGADYTSIRSAVAVAADGDVIRVAPGTYGYFGVFGKALRIHAVQPGTVTVAGTVRIQQLTSDQVTVIDGLNVRAVTPSLDPALVIAECDGRVRIQNSAFDGSYSEHWAEYTARIIDSDDVVLTHVRIDSASDCNSWYCFTQDALEIAQSSVHLYDSQINSAIFPQGLVGASAIRVRDSSLLLSGCTVQGGDGSEGSWGGLSCSCSDGYAGGDGVACEGTVDVRVIGGSITPGGGGAGNTLCGCSFGANGESIRMSAGTTVVTETAEPVSLEFDALQQEGASFTIASAGAASYPIVIALGPETSSSRLPGYVGSLHVTGPFGSPRRLFVGASPAALQVSAPQLPTWGIERLFIQSVQLLPTGPVLGPVQALTIVDSAW